MLWRPHAFFVHHFEIQTQKPIGLTVTLSLFILLKIYTSPRFRAAMANSVQTVTRNGHPSKSPNLSGRACIPHPIITALEKILPTYSSNQHPPPHHPPPKPQSDLFCLLPIFPLSCSPLHTRLTIFTLQSPSLCPEVVVLSQTMPSSPLHP